MHLQEVFDMQYLEVAGTVNQPSLKHFIAQINGYPIGQLTII